MLNSNSILAEQTNLAPFDGKLYHLQSVYSSTEADDHLQTLLARLAWQTEHLVLYGRRIPVPRLMAWYGDPDARYRYSGVDHLPTPWPVELQTLRTDVEATCQHRFNSVLANLYRDGRDSMGCHADNEKELGENPLIASLSFGATRLLRFRHNKNRATLNVELSHGDLLIMAGELQHHWRHELPKTRQTKSARINLTFRQIVAGPNSPG